MLHPIGIHVYYILQAYVKYLEWKYRKIVEFKLEDEQCGFRLPGYQGG